PQPRSYAFDIPKKAQIGALRAALSQKLQDGAVIVVDKLEASAERKTRETAEMLRRLGATGKTLVIDVRTDEAFARTARNISGVTLASATRVTPRELMDTAHVVATREAIEKLQEALGPGV